MLLRHFPSTVATNANRNRELVAPGSSDWRDDWLWRSECPWSPCNSWESQLSRQARRLRIDSILARRYPARCQQRCDDRRREVPDRAVARTASRLISRDDFVA